MRRSLSAIFLCLGVLGSALVQAPSGAAAAPPLECEVVSRNVFEHEGPSMGFRICTGEVATTDGSSRLDVTVTLPAKGRGPFPLIVMLHGLGGSKYSNESTFVEGSGGSHHYNNLWFASKGYMVLTYTARGWDLPNDPDDEWPPESHSDCVDQGRRGYQDDPQSVDDDDQTLYPGLSPACYIQIAHLNYEIKDTQYLVGRLVDGTLVDADGVATRPRRVGVTGVSYGGGQTWLLTRKNQWRSPKGTLVRVRAAAPLIGWTDILDALTPNGRRSDEESTQSLPERKAEPVGVKNDYIDVFYDAVRFRGTDFSATTDYVQRWKQEFDKGEPYEGSALVDDAVAKLLTKRSAFFVPKKNAFDTRILSVQGFTDGIFPIVQSLKMYNRLRAGRVDAGRVRYPIKLYFGDWGHPPAQNKQAETDYVVGLVNEWFRFFLKRAGERPSMNVEARVAVCDGSDGRLGDLYRARRWESLDDEGGYLLASSATPTLHTPADDPHAARLIPADGTRSNPNGVPDGSCRTTNTDIDPDNWAMNSVPLNEDFRMLGMPRVVFTADPSGDEMYVAARLWDVDRGDPMTGEDDVQTLVTRGVYRLDGTEEQEVSFQLFGNAYEFDAGHEIKLELTADDSPSWQLWQRTQPDKTGSIEIGGSVLLEIPAARCARLAGGCP